MNSDEAVEAAAKAIRESVQSPQAAIVGPYVASEMQARAALEAAAPYIASAWHDAVSEAYVEGSLSADQANVIWNKNPYRRQA